MADTGSPTELMAADRSDDQRQADAGGGGAALPSNPRAHITEAAAQLFDLDGYHQTSMADVASAAGLAKATLYHYYSSKHELLFSIHERFMQRLSDLYQAAAIETGEEPCDMLARVVSNIFDVLTSHGAYLRVFFRHYTDLPAEMKELVQRRSDRYADLVTQLISEAQRRGEIRGDLEPRLAAFAIFGMCNWAYMWLDPEGPQSPDVVARTFWSLVSEGLFVRNSNTADATARVEEGASRR